jgi:hypothetical protein
MCTSHQIFFQVIQSITMRWDGLVARRGEERCLQGLGRET